MHSFLAGAARHARLVLIGGLVAGMALPDVAVAMRPWIGEMVAGLLFLAALRIGPRQAVGALGDVGASVALALVFQIAMPLAAIGLFSAFGAIGTAYATFFVLMLAAAPVTASINLTIITGNDPAPALRQIVVGTGLIPLTVLPVFWLMPAFGAPRAVFEAAGGLMLLIVAAAGLAFLLRTWLLKTPSARALQSIDGLSAIALAVVVIGLMSAVGPAVRYEPAAFALTLALVCAVSFAIQLVVALLARRAGWRARSAATAIGAANRNVALFLAVLPQQVVDPILLFIGCYQIPMYLTPAVFGRLYRPEDPRLTERYTL